MKHLRQQENVCHLFRVSSNGSDDALELQYSFDDDRSNYELHIKSPNDDIVYIFCYRNFSEDIADKPGSSVFRAVIGHTKDAQVHWATVLFVNEDKIISLL